MDIPAVVKAILRLHAAGATRVKVGDVEAEFPPAASPAAKRALPADPEQTLDDAVLRTISRRPRQ